MRWLRWLILAAGMVFVSANRAAEPNTSGEQEVGWQAAGAHGVVVAGGVDAVHAGLTILQEGGNAVDAAVATLIALTVTDSGACCFGGEVPIMIYDGRRQVIEVLSGQGAAPGLATREYFVGKGGIRRKGIEAAAVPAFLEACVTALDRFGTRSFSQVSQPTLRILDRHAQSWHANLARTLRRLTDAEGEAGRDRCRGLRLVADYFYRGPLTQELDAWSRANGGLLRYSDLATHVTRIEDPIAIDYHGYTVCKCGPWTQGPYLLQTLRLLDGFDLKKMGMLKSDTIHVMVEAMKLALADRDVYYADPLFEPVPLQDLLSPEYTALRRPLIDLRRASQECRPGDPLSGSAVLDRLPTASGPARVVKDTTTCLVADQWGNVVAATPSGWSGALVGETGIWLGSRLQSFNLQPGHPNCIAPGKRPRITLTPTILLKAGRPVLAISVAGGDTQDQATLQILINHIDFELMVDELVTKPRFMTDHLFSSFGQSPPDLGSLRINSEVGEAVINELRSRGHHVQVMSGPISFPTVIRIDASPYRLRGAGDPKAKRHTLAF